MATVSMAELIAKKSDRLHQWGGLLQYTLNVVTYVVIGLILVIGTAILLDELRKRRRKRRQFQQHRRRVNQRRQQYLWHQRYRQSDAQFGDLPVLPPIAMNEPIPAGGLEDFDD